jgi:hypothetical protein
MPRLPIDYSKTIIYKIVCNDLNVCDLYVGSTTDFIRRKREHKSKSNNEKSKSYNVKLYQMIRTNGGWSNWSMVEIEKYKCNDSNEARARERYYYELLNCNMNTNAPFRNNRKEIDKIYYDKNQTQRRQNSKNYYYNNKEKMIEQNKQYRENNKEKIKEYNKKYRESKKQNQQNENIVL